MSLRELIVDIANKMSLQSKINEDLKKAQKEKDVKTISVLRLLNSAIKNLMIEKKVEKEAELEDAEIEKLIKTQIKQLKDAVKDFIAGGREDLAEATRAEMDILNEYLPEGLNEEEVRKIVKSQIAEFDDATSNNFGQIMGRVMKEIAGRAEGDAVKKIIEEELSK